MFGSSSNGGTDLDDRRRSAVSSSMVLFALRCTNGDEISLVLSEDLCSLASTLRHSVNSQ